MSVFVFTKEQLYKLFEGYDELKKEYMNKYDIPEKDSKLMASADVVAGLEAEQYLYSIGMFYGKHSQVLDFVEREEGS